MPVTQCLSMGVLSPSTGMLTCVYSYGCLISYKSLHPLSHYAEWWFNTISRTLILWRLAKAWHLHVSQYHTFHEYCNYEKLLTSNRLNSDRPKTKVLIVTIPTIHCICTSTVSFLSLQDRSSVSGLDKAIEYYQKSAGILQFLRDRFAHAPSLDMNAETLTLLIQLMLVSI